MTNHAREAARKIAERPSIVASHDHNLNARIRSQNEWCDKVEHVIQAAIDAATAEERLKARARVAANDARIIRIAKALAEGCDGREFASDDAKELHRKYEAIKDREPGSGFDLCRHKAFAEFISEVLNGS